MNRIVEVRPLDGYRIWLRFSDGAEGEVDLSELAGRGVFAAWAEPNLFKAVRVEDGGGIMWPGEIDMCPDALYLRLTGKAVDEVFPSLKPTPVDAELSRFYGIVIKMYFGDHDPPTFTPSTPRTGP